MLVHKEGSAVTEVSILGSPAWNVLGKDGSVELLRWLLSVHFLGVNLAWA